MISLYIMKREKKKRFHGTLDTPSVQRQRQQGALPEPFHFACAF